MKIHQLRKKLTENEYDEAPEFSSDLLKAGTVVYHGTSAVDFDERADDLEGPLWVSRSPTVAEWFAKRDDQGTPRIISYTVSDDQNLLVIEGRHTFEEIEEYYGIDASWDPHEMAEHICTMGYDGWVIPDNYKDGDDIMLCRPALIYGQTAPTG